MKKIFLFLLLIGTSFTVKTQVVCAGVSPASIAGNYAFSWGTPANTWGSPDFSIPGTYVTGDLMLVDDGSVGNSPASGIPLANYGCAPLVNNLAGKIAVVYRYDGVTASTICFMSEKALIAQNAGAIAVVIVNRPGASPDLSTGGASSAPSVTIPVVLIDFNDGNALRSEILNGPVTLFIGNKSGLYLDDIGLVNDKRLISKAYSSSSQLAQNATEFNLNLGARIYNYGTNNQSNVSLNAKIVDPSGTTVYNNSIGSLSIASGDSVDVLPGTANVLPLFSMASYPQGRYKLTYNVSLGGPDGYTGDNTIVSSFVISDSIIGYSEIDTLSNLPFAQNFSRPSTNSSTFSSCMVIDNPNASRIGIEGIYFSAATGYGSGVLLTGEEMGLFVFEWNDVFVDLNDAALAFANLNQVGFGYYYYPSDLQSQTVYGQLSNPIVLSDNQRYLACVQTTNVNIFFGYDNKTNYLWNESFYLQPIVPNESDGTYFASGFGVETVPTIATKIFNASEMALNEGQIASVNIYPNPATNAVTITLNSEETYAITVFDLAGKSVLSKSVLPSSSEIQIDSLQPGIYLFAITFENGTTSQYRVVKK